MLQSRRQEEAEKSHWQWVKGEGIWMEVTRDDQNGNAG